jgi:hypothetical protein
MSRAPAVAVSPSRPTLLDYLFLLAGCSLSLYLIRLQPLAADPGDGVPGPWRDLFLFLPDLMRVPEGILLLWPLFFATQFLRRRPQPLTSAEWLWVIAWLGTTILAGLAVSRFLPALSGFAEYGPVALRLWYMVLTPAMGALGVCLTLYGLVGRGPAPWTHGLALALVLWPLAPAAVILTMGKFN